MDTFGSNGRGNLGPIMPKPSHWLKVAIFLLVLTILIAMASSITEVVRGLEEDHTWLIMGIGLFFGWVLTQLATRKWSAALLTVSVGALFSGMQVGRLWDNLYTFLYEVSVWGRQAVPAVVNAFNGEEMVWPSIGTFVLAFLDYMTSFYLMLQRLVLWVIRFPRMNNDFIAILMVWSMAIWLTVVWASWMLWRSDRPLEGIIPSFLLVGIALSYSDADTDRLLIMLGATIALMVMVAQLSRERDWIEKKVGYSGMIRKSSTQAAMILSTFLVISSAGITSIDVEEIKDRWDDFTRDRTRSSQSNGDGSISGSLGIESDPNRISLAEQFGKISRGGLPTNHLVGSGPELADEVIMVVRVDETDPQTGRTLEVEPADQRYYYRSLTFDRYTSQGWFSNNSKIYVYSPEQEAVKTYTSKQRLITQEVRLEGAGNLVYAIGELAVVNRQYNVAWREGKGLSAFIDMFGATLEARSYEAYSIVPVYTEEDLRNQSQVYPDWIYRYLEIPESVPERVLDLSYELTYRELSAYDKAVAIEQYLRSFPYTLDLPEKPVSEDIADYFLFELQRGYCDYYASTMVVLARAAGLPARLAVGYAGGTYDLENEYYVVTGDLAHSWVEIYFPDYGWVTFEPTAGREEIEREVVLPELASLPEFEREINFEQDRLRLTIPQLILAIILGTFAVLTLAVMIWLRVDIYVLRRQDLRKAFARLYQRLLWFSTWLDVPRGDTQTPLEFSAEMNTRLKDLDNRSKMLRNLDVAAGYVDDIVKHANQTAYSNVPPDVIDRGQTVRTWRTLRWQLFFAALWYQADKRRPRKRKRHAAESV